MYVNLNIHRPRPEAVDAVIASMRRYGAAVRTQPGLVAVYTVVGKDGELIGLALWESEEAANAGRAAGRDAVKGDPFDQWESAPIEAHSGETT